MFVYGNGFYYVGLVVVVNNVFGVCYVGWVIFFYGGLVLDEMVSISIVYLVFDIVRVDVLVEFYVGEGESGDVRGGGGLWGGCGVGGKVGRGCLYW